MLCSGKTYLAYSYTSYDMILFIFNPLTAVKSTIHKIVICYFQIEVGM